VSKLLVLLEEVTGGGREKELETRAQKLAATPIGPAGETPGLPPDLSLLDRWIEQKPEEARRQSDEIAILIAQGEVARGARWKLSLSLEESLVVHPDSQQLNPFALVAARFTQDTTPLPQQLSKSWKTVPAG
jgi:hypothetical protein